MLVLSEKNIEQIYLTTFSLKKKYELLAYTRIYLEDLEYLGCGLCLQFFP